jgi:hypothetical protein
MHRHLFIFLLLPLFTGAFTANASAQDPLRTKEAMVVLQVPGLDDAQLARLATEVGRQRNTGIEYSCTWSGVLVLRFNSLTVVDRADVVVIARRLLADAGITARAEVLHVHTEVGGAGKC